tara:strand:+ start:158 stop:553 length:396 start_codon:yes stop_codon:yes gene_type:complete
MNDPIKHFLSFYDNYATREDMEREIANGNIEEDHPYFKDLEAFESVKNFIEKTYEITFGNDAINRGFTITDVLDQLKELSNNSIMNEFKTTQELNSYILNRVNHETDIIMESEWFDELIEKKVNEILKKKS